MTIDGDGEGHVPNGINGEDDDENLWQGSQGMELKKSKPENVNFAKKAKRVDVKRLKDDIWVGLRGLVEKEGALEVGSGSEAVSLKAFLFARLSWTAGVSCQRRGDMVLSPARLLCNLSLPSLPPFLIDPRMIKQSFSFALLLHTSDGFCLIALKCRLSIASRTSHNRKLPKEK